MNNSFQLSPSAFNFAIMMAGLSAQKTAAAKNVNQRPIDDFVTAQGTKVGFAPYDYVSWLSVTDEMSIRLALVDYAGVTNRALRLGLGTTYTGSVTERPLTDGRAEVVVTLQTKNALTWVADLGESFDQDDVQSASCPLLFGATGHEVKEGATPALGESFLQLVLKNTAIGAPLPDLFSAFVTGDTYREGQELISVSFSAKALLHLPNGKKNQVVIDQFGRVTMLGQCNIFQDNFDIERVEVSAVSDGTSPLH